MQNFWVDGVDIIDVLRRHTPASQHSVLANTGQLTHRELPIPVNPVTLRPGPAFLRLPTLDLSQGNARLKMMFKTQVSGRW